MAYRKSNDEPKHGFRAFENRFYFLDFDSVEQSNDTEIETINPLIGVMPTQEEIDALGYDPSKWDENGINLKVKEITSKYILFSIDGLGIAPVKEDFSKFLTSSRIFSLSLLMQN